MLQNPTFHVLKKLFLCELKDKKCYFLCVICVLLYVMSHPFGNKILIFSQNHVKMFYVLLCFVLFYFLQFLTFIFYIFINQSDLLIGACFTKKGFIFGLNIVQTFILFKF